eukprot:12314_1
MQQKRANEISFLPLYTSHLLQTFGDRLWQFAIPILFTEFYTHSILPQSVFAFATNAAVFVFMPTFGSWIDIANRLFVVRSTILIQNICIIISSVLLYIMSDIYSTNPNIDLPLALYFSGCIVTSMVGQIMGMGATLALEKDWVVVLCQKNETILTTINGRMRRIDLFCKLLAPALFGVMTQYLGQSGKEKIQYGLIWIVLWNIIGFFLEYCTIHIAYRNNPILAEQKKIDPNAKKQNNFSKLFNGWKCYIKSNMIWVSLSYCMLYCSVLDGGTLVTAYLRFQGLPFSVLGIAKGIGACFGIFGTFLTPCLANKCGLKMELIGIFTIWLFWICLIPAGIELFVENVFNKPLITDNNINIHGINHINCYVILFSMIIARLGLWSFDLVENQLMQTKVKQSVRAQINGVQVGVSQLFSLFIYTLGMLFSDVNQFYILVFITLSIIFSACVLYTLWYFAECCFNKHINSALNSDLIDKERGHSMLQSPYNESLNSNVSTEHSLNSPLVPNERLL